jgi:hypothetical protein
MWRPTKKDATHPVHGDHSEVIGDDPITLVTLEFVNVKR